jgi:hypothetical protein
MNRQVANADHARFSSNTTIADIDVIVASGKIDSGVCAQRDVAIAGGVAIKRVKTGGRVVQAFGVV